MNHPKTPKSIGSVSNKYDPSTKSGFYACISSRITAVIHITVDHQIDYNCFNEPFAVSPCEDLYWDMHGLIFETSIWLLAGSTRFYRKSAMRISITLLIFQARCSINQCEYRKSELPPISAKGCRFRTQRSIFIRPTKLHTALLSGNEFGYWRGNLHFSMSVARMLRLPLTQSYEYKLPLLAR